MAASLRWWGVAVKWLSVVRKMRRGVRVSVATDKYAFGWYIVSVVSWQYCGSLLYYHVT